MRKIILPLAAAAIVCCTAAAGAAELRSGIELLVACSPTETSPQAMFDACLDAIVVRVSELSARGSNCPKIATEGDIAFWVVNGRQAVVNYWAKAGADIAARLSPNETIDEPLKLMGYGACISSTGS